MAKPRARAITIYLPEALIAQIEAENPNRSELVRQVLEAHFGRKPSDTEIGLAIEYLVQRAREAAQEGKGRTARQSAPGGAGGPLGCKG